MSKFNLTKPSTSVPNAINLAGGVAFKESDKMNLLSIALTSFVANKFYRKDEQEVAEVIRLLGKVDPLFSAKVALYARKEGNMRSISHVIAVFLAPYLAGKPYARSFYDKIVVRLDDVTEILSYYKYIFGKNSFPHAMTDGFARAFSRFDEYSFAKYQQRGKEVSLVDAIRICRPSPNLRNSQAIKKLIKNELKNTKTWEAKLSAAGQIAAESEEYTVDELKGAAWKDLLMSGELGYFACLRNLRNILVTDNEEIVNLACNLIRDREKFSKSKVLPFRFLVAIDEISKLGINAKNSRNIWSALNDILEYAVDNVEKLDGENVVVIDESGSMNSKNVAITAGYFGALLTKAWNADTLMFATSGRYVNLNPSLPVSEMAKTITSSMRRGGTNFHSIFKTLNKKYDRIVILSDMQGWIGNYSPHNTYKEYCKQYNANPIVFSWDLAGYGTLQQPEGSVVCLAGMSQKMIDVINEYSKDKNILIKKVEAMEI